MLAPRDRAFGYGILFRIDVCARSLLKMLSMSGQCYGPKKLTSSELSIGSCVLLKDATAVASACPHCDEDIFPRSIEKTGSVSRTEMFRKLSPHAVTITQGGVNLGLFAANENYALQGTVSKSMFLVLRQGSAFVFADPFGGLRFSAPESQLLDIPVVSSKLLGSRIIAHGKKDLFVEPG